MAKSFNQAFREARTSGLDKFEWNGKWYGTKYATEKNASSVSHVEKGKGQQKYATSDSKSKDRYVIKKVNGNQYGIFDKKDGYFVGKAFNSAEEAQKYGNSDQFKQDTGELVVTASGKINSNTAGYVPVQGTGLVDRNGNTRVYKNYETGQKVVTDNYGNKVGDSYDPNAEKEGFEGWVINTGSQQDIRRGQAGQARNQANIRETNQKAQQKKDRQTDERAFQIKGIQDMQGMVNLAQGAINLPNHAITGALKLVRDDYNLNDYLEGFTLDGTWNGKQQVGLGDLLEVQNPYMRFATNAMNPLTIIGTAAGTRMSNMRTAEGKPFRMTVTEDSGAGSSFRRNNRPHEGMGNSKIGRGKGNKTYVTQYGGTHRSGSNPIQRELKIPTTTLVYNKGKFSPYGMTFAFEKDYIPQSVTPQETPTANFYYDSSEYNPTVMGRIQTGDFVPSTVGPNWNGEINGGQVRVNNRKNAGYTFPAFGGKTAGNGKDNETNRYLYSGYTR